MKISYHAASDVGLKRKINEDYQLVDKKLGLYLLADGLGGHPYGEIASKIACSSIQEYFVNHRLITEEKLNVLHKFPEGLPLAGCKLVYSIVTANRAIIEMTKRDHKYKGMGSTIVAILASEEDGLYLANVGDSRIYRSRGELLEQLTVDHSVLNEQLRKGKYTEEELADSPMKHQLARALGHMAKSRVDIKTVKPEKDDIFLLCSDGLSGMVTENDLIQVIRDNSGDLEKACSLLVEKAKEGGGGDNITMILVRVDDA